MKRRTQLKLKQLFVIICAWLIVGVIISIYDHLVLFTQYSRGPAPEYSFLFSLAANIGSALLGAILGGGFLVFFINVKYQDKPYAYTILTVSISFILIVFIISVIRGLITIPIQTGKSITDPESLAALSEFLMFNTIRIKNIIVWSIVVALTQLFMQMNSKFGYGVFWNIIRGKYNIPKEENRIFMSLDLNSSTTIAEKLGDEKYHGFLKEFFADITNPILDNKGEIYQYVGDEVVIAWKYDDGIANNRCVECFFDIKLHIEKKKESYINRYGIVPTFKAGIHWGKVIVGEVGIIKRDITYSGDVMNTTSRIRNKCKEYNVDIIASGDLLKELSSKKYLTQQLGSIKLKGKEKEVLLSALTPAV